MPTLTELGNDAVGSTDQPWSTLQFSDPGMTHEAERPNPAIAELARRLNLTGQNLYNTWISPAERLGRAATSGTLDVTDPQTAGDAFGVVGGVAGARMPFAKIGELGSAGGKSSITAYHGSPHDFDRFDVSKIGTGEGAQAYGHGLYFAENPAVAEDYKRVLAAKASLFGADRIDAEAQKWIQQQGGIEQAKAAIDQEMKQWAGNKNTVAYLQTVKDAMKPPNPGKMYQVAINADPEHFLDWDKPLSEQPPEVQETLKRAGISVRPTSETAKNYTMDAMLADLASEHGSKQAASNKLHQAGVPGIKYFDQGSRASGEGSRNFVVFDDKTIDILKKYGLLGLFGGGAASQLSPNAGQQ
jgi:hypothetical protein